MNQSRKLERRHAAAGAPPKSGPKYRVRDAWTSFERAILPPDCSDVQRSEMRRAFFAGAFSIMDELSKAMSHEDDMTDADERVMIDLAIEQEEYLAALRMGRA